MLHMLLCGCVQFMHVCACVSGGGRCLHVCVCVQVGGLCICLVDASVGVCTRACACIWLRLGCVSVCARLSLSRLLIAVCL